MDPALARERLAGMPWFPRFSLTVGGLGFQRFASGTWGSLPPCVAVLVLVAVLPAGWGWVIDAVLAAMLLWAIVGCELWGAKAEEMLGLKDPSCVVLDEIAGIGPTRKRALLKHFGSAKGVSRAGVDDLQAVGGISAEMAKRIYDFFHERG